MDCNGVTIGIDPGVITSVVVTETNSGKLIEAFEFELSYKKEFCQRMIEFKEKFQILWFVQILNKYAIDKILLEVNYSIGPSMKPYLYQRGGNAIDLVKLVSTIFAIYQTLISMELEVITIPATYWLSKEKFQHKKYLTQDLIDFDIYKQIKRTRDGILDAVLMSYRYNHDPDLQYRVENFMKADFSCRK